MHVIYHDKILPAAHAITDNRDYKERQTAMKII
jgi:hypothetical protein